jgi:hypothetical protein
MTATHSHLPPLAGLLLVVLVACSPLKVTAASITEQLQALQLDIPHQRLPAPPFELPDMQGQLIRLEDYSWFCSTSGQHSANPVERRCPP